MKIALVIKASLLHVKRSVMSLLCKCTVVKTYVLIKSRCFLDYSKVSENIMIGYFTKKNIRKFFKVDNWISVANLTERSQGLGCLHTLCLPVSHASY